MRRYVAVGLGIAAFLAPPAAWSAEIADEVTIRLREFFDEGSMSRQVELSGRVATSGAGEPVEVLAKECGPNRHYRVVAGTRTVGGGSWRIVTNEAPDYVQVPVNSYFRARWRGHVSEPVLNRVPALVSIYWRPRVRRVDVSVSTGTSGQSLRGRFVELQRRIPGTDTWARVRRSRLSRGVRYGWFDTRFSVPTRGLTLRVVVPAATGTPCFAASVSETWRS